MIGGQIKVGEEIRPDDPVLDISYCEIEFKIRLAYCDAASNVAIALDFRAIRGAKLSSGRAEATLLTSWGNNG